MMSTATKGLTRGVFHTLLGEASFIVNQTPLWAVSTDPNNPEPLCLAMLLQQQHTEGSGPIAGEHLTTEALQHYGPARYSVIRELASSFWSAWQKGLFCTTISVLQMDKIQTQPAGLRPGPNEGRKSTT